MKKINFGVLCPIQGKYYSVLWSTHNEGQHLVLAKSLNGLKHALRALFGKYCKSSNVDHYDYDFKLRPEDARLIEVVTPPPSYCARVETKLYEQAVDNFWQHMQGLTHKLQESELPPQLAFCPACISQKFRGCEKCDWRAVQPQGTTWEELFDQFGEDLESLDKRRYGDTLKPSAAPTVNESELDSVYGVYPDFGHHQRGIAITCLAEHQEHVSTRAMFFFKKLRLVDISSSIEDLKQTQKKNREDAKRSQAAFRKSLEARDLEEKKKYMAFFEKMRQAAQG